jgi:AmmeMemoRadiSam system protein B/AmmeMemoRadiSam system protein A
MRVARFGVHSAAALLLLLAAGCVSTHAAHEPAQGVREPAVAGQFYPDDAKALDAALDAYSKDAVPPSGQRPAALISPHAGYIFSGQIAADAWNQAAGHVYDTIVLLGTNHSGLNTRRVAVFPGSGLRTPLGVVPVDDGLVQALLSACGECAADAAPHAREHSIEVQLPFVQRLFPRAKVVAAVVGPDDPTLPERFGRALAGVLRDRRALVVASSDLSHYPPASDAAGVDRRTLEAIASMDVDRLRSATAQSEARGIRDLATCACGEAPIRAAIAAAKALGATRGHVVSYANSGDVAVGEPDRVVGYGAVALTDGARATDTSGLPGLQAPGDAQLTDADRQRLLALARETIRRYLESGTVPLGRGFSIAADRHQGLFVTLNKRGNLRGCIGQMQPTGPIRRLVPTMALAAAFQDQRFDKVKASELKDIEIEISLLTPFTPVPSPGSVVPGRDGVVLQKAGRSAVFLPQVATEQGWSRNELLDNLCVKAGLEKGCWSSGAKLSTFQAQVFGEEGRGR